MHNEADQTKFEEHEAHATWPAPPSFSVIPPGDLDANTEVMPQHELARICCETGQVQP